MREQRVQLISVSKGISAPTRILNPRTKRTATRGSIRKPTWTLERRPVTTRSGGMRNPSTRMMRSPTTARTTNPLLDRTGDDHQSARVVQVDALGEDRPGPPRLTNTDGQTGRDLRHHPAAGLVVHRVPEVLVAVACRGGYTSAGRPTMSWAMNQTARK